MICYLSSFRSFRRFRQLAHSCAWEFRTYPRFLSRRLRTCEHADRTLWSPSLALWNPSLPFWALSLPSVVWAPPSVGAQTQPVWAPHLAGAQTLGATFRWHSISVWAPPGASAQPLNTYIKKHSDGSPGHRTPQAPSACAPLRAGTFTVTFLKSSVAILFDLWPPRAHRPAPLLSPVV